MIEAPNNLACLQHRTDPKYIHLHTQTQCKLCYHLKHKYGISPEYNSHTTEQPWYGMGQGTGNASNRWVIGTDSMANSYSKKAHGWNIPSPSAQHSVKQDLLAFIDDVNLFIGKPNNITEDKFIDIAQADINWWHGILRATRGELNTMKCYWSDFNLQFDTIGNPSLLEKLPQDTQLHLTNLDGSKAVLMPTKFSDSLQHLGVHISMDGNTKAKACTLFK